MPAPTSGSCIGARRRHGVNPANAGLHATRWPWPHDTLETVVIPAQARTQRLPALPLHRQLPLARASPSAADRRTLPPNPSSAHARDTPTPPPHHPTTTSMTPHTTPP